MCGVRARPSHYFVAIIHSPHTILTPNQMHFFSNQHFHISRFFPFLTTFLQQDCPNGRLTPAKFVDMYKMFFPSGNAEEFCDHVFRTFDMDKNGYIDFKVSKRFYIEIDYK